MIFVVAVACIFWVRTVSLVLPIPWMAFLIGLVLAVGVFLGTYVLLDRVYTKQLRQRICPACGAKLTPSGGGFVDGGAPTARELLLYAISIAVPFVVWVILDGLQPSYA